MSDAVDALTVLAPLLRVSPQLDTLCRFGADWQAAHPPSGAGSAAFHLIGRGNCLLDLPDRPPVRLESGDIVILPHGDPHRLRGVTTPARTTSAQKRAAGGIRHIDFGAVSLHTNTDDPDVELICGRLTFEQPQHTLARAALPPLIHLRTAEDTLSGRLPRMVAAIKEELETGAAGARAVSRDLASALMIMALREHLLRHGANDGLWRLLSHPQTARAVTALLDHPAYPWTLESLAAAAHTSRATLVRDFRRLAQMSPLGFLSDLRLGLARHTLSVSDRPLIDIALEAGYQSESAFSRAFQRRFAVRPGTFRRNTPR